MDSESIKRNQPRPKNRRESLKKRRGSDEKPLAQDFLEVLEHHMAEAKVSVRQLSEYAGIAHTTIRAWKQGVGGISKANVNSLAFALAQAYDDNYEEKQKNAEIPAYYFGKARLDDLLNELLSAAGYKAIQGRRDNMVWEQILQAQFPEDVDIEREEMSKRIQKPILKVGLFPWAQFAFTDSSGSYRGASIDIIDEVCRLIAVTWEAVPCDLGKIYEKILYGDIHLTLPLIFVPQRMRFFTTSVFLECDNYSLRTGVNAIIHKDSLIHVVKDKNIIPNTHNDLHMNRLNFNYMAGSIGETFAQYIVGHQEGNYKICPVYCNTLEEGWRDVIEKQTDEDGRYRVFICDQFTVFDANHKNNNAIGLLSRSPVYLPLVIYAHRQEKLLMEAINGCLKLMDRNKFWEELAKKFPFVEKIK